MKPLSSLLFVFLLVIGRISLAQVYPVQATVQLTPPYSLYLADYVESGTERLALNIFLADIARPSLDVRFRLRIVGQGVTIETKPEYRPAPISIQGGVPMRLISTDLADYFNSNNLNFQGITRREYDQRGKLPEGVYQFCFEVLEYNRGAKISNTACGTAWMILNDPPIVNLPRQNEKLKVQSPQNILLQWTPRHTGSPNSAFTTNYDVTMVEVWPSTRNPNDAILTSPPIFETTTSSTTVVYGPAETPLEPGRRYAFRVRARSIAGVDELDLFKNNGYSEVISFVYGDACDLPTGINATSIGTSKFSLAWDGLFNHTAYRVRYREAGTTNWYENNVTSANADIYSLKPATVYEYQVAATCGFYDGQYSTVAKVTTNPLPEAEYACGAPMGTFNIDPKELTGSLKAGDIIQAGDFDVKLTKVTGSNGVFSGEGVIEVPYFNKAKVKTSFSDISVNKELRMVNGYMNVTGAAVDIIPSGVMDAMNGLTEVLNTADSALNTIEENLPEQFDPNSFVADSAITVKNGISSVYKDTDGSVVIVDNKGTETRLPAGTSAAVKDDNDNGYLVDKKGNVHKVTADVAAKAGNREYNLSLKFAANANMQYGFDQRKYDAIGKDYEQLKNYSVAWKSVASGGVTDVVTAILSGTGVDANQIKFEQSGVALQAQPFANNQTTLSVRGGSDGTEEGLLALYSASDTGKVQVLGKLNVVSYNKISNSVVIVPVNTTTLPSGLTPQIIEDSLNAIYKQAVVDWKVSIASPIEVALGDSFDDGDSELLSNYTDDMKKVIKAFGKLQDETFYLFLVNNPKSSDGLGYMPRGKQAGFIFVDRHGADKSALMRTMAHELGHGAFGLHHTFKEPNFTLTKGATDNLMDYPSGNKLYKYQWDKMRYTDIVIGLFEEDEEGESVIVYAAIDSTLLNSDNTFAFIVPSSEYISLPKDVTNPIFFYGIPGATKFNTLTGSLIGFIDKGVRYTAKFGNDTFKGYFDSSGNSYKYTPTKSTPEGFLLGLPFVDHYKIQKFKFVSGELEQYSQPQENQVAGLINEMYFSPRLYTKNPLLKEARYSYTNSDVIGTEQISITVEQLNLISKHLSKPEILMLYKIGQIKQMYPNLFDQFTEHLDDWNSISTPVVINTYGSTSYTNPVDLLHEWDKYYYLNKSDLGPKWQSDAFEFYKEFLTKLRDFIYRANEAKQQFINNVTSTTNHIETSRFLCGLSDDEIAGLKWEDRLKILQSVTSGAIGDGQGCSNSEANIVRLVKLTPEAQRSSLLLSLVNEKTGSGENLLKALVGKNIDDLNGTEFINFVSIIHSFASKYNVYDSKDQAVVNRKNGRYFSYDPATFTFSPSSIDIHDNGKIWMAHRQEFTFWFFTNYYDQVEVGPYESITLHFDDNRITGQFTFHKDSTYTTSALMAYMLLYGGMSDQLMSQGSVVLNTALFATGIGELNAAIQSANVLKIGLAGLDLATGAVGIAMDAGLKQKLQSTETGQKILKFWEVADLVYGSARITQTLLEAAINARNATKLIDRTGLSETERELIDRTEKQADDVIEQAGREGMQAATSVNKMLGSYDEVTKTLTLSTSDISKVVDEVPPSGILGTYEVQKIKIENSSYDFPAKATMFEEGGQIKCYIDNGYCFPAGTPVLVQNNYNVNIEEIKKGDKVVSYNHEKDIRVISTVKSVLKRTAKRLSKLVFAGGTILMMTPEHPIFANGEYIQAQHVHAGDSVLTSDNNHVYITSVATFDTVVVVYNFEVENNSHNYFAGLGAYLVHNSCGWKTIKESVTAEAFGKFHQTIIGAGLSASARKELYTAIANLSEKAKFLDDFSGSIDAIRAFSNDLKLIDAWKRLDNLGAVVFIRKDFNALKYVANGRSNKIMLNVEELLGGHSIARHGSQLPLSEMEQRVLGTHPTMPQSRSALKFDTDVIHEDAVDKAFNHYKMEIEAHFNSGATDYFERDFDYVNNVGEGYYNSGTRSNPVSQHVTTTKVRIAFKSDPLSPGGYILDSAYPLYEP